MVAKRPQELRFRSQVQFIFLIYLTHLLRHLRKKLLIPNRTYHNLLMFLNTSTETFVEIYTQSRSKRIKIIRFRYTYINIFAAFRISLVLIYIPPYSVKDTFTNIG